MVSALKKKIILQYFVAEIFDIHLVKFFGTVIENKVITFHSSSRNFIKIALKYYCGKDSTDEIK